MTVVKNLKRKHFGLFIKIVFFVSLFVLLLLAHLTVSSYFDLSVTLPIFISFFLALFITRKMALAKHRSTESDMRRVLRILRAVLLFIALKTGILYASLFLVLSYTCGNNCSIGYLAVTLFAYPIVIFVGTWVAFITFIFWSKPKTFRFSEVKKSTSSSNG